MIRLSYYLNPKSVAAESFRTLRTSLHYSADKDKTKMIMVTSPGPGDGKTMVVTNLATSLAQAGSKVLLVDADLRKPRCHRSFSLSNRQGLTNVLVDGGDPLQMAQKTSMASLSVLTSGPIPPNPAELLDSDAMNNLLVDLRDSYDHILVDSPPTGPLADASILASKVDGIILVLVAGETRIDVAQDIKDTLERAQGKVLGIVLNKVKYNSNEYKYRYYYYDDDKEQGKT